MRAMLVLALFAPILVGCAGNAGHVRYLPNQPTYEYTGFVDGTVRWHDDTCWTC